MSTSDYKEGLNGNKPNLFDHLTSRQEAIKDQERGYRDYLRNEELAERVHERIREDENNESSSYSSEDSDSTGTNRSATSSTKWIEDNKLMVISAVCFPFGFLLVMTSRPGSLLFLLGIGLFFAGLPAFFAGALIVAGVAIVVAVLGAILLGAIYFIEYVAKAPLR